MKKSAPKSAKQIQPPVPPKAKKIEAPKAPAPKIEEPKLLALSNEERLTLRLHESETVRWASEAHLRQAKRSAYLAKIDPERLLGKMDEEIRAVATKSQQARQQYEAVTKKIEERLKIKLADYSFDDETGALVPHK
jgi:hypothetical protein